VTKLDDLAQVKGIESIRHNSLIREDRKKCWIKLLNDTQNFLKHADRDPEGLLDFNPEWQRVLIVDASQPYAQLSQNAPFPEAVLYGMWFSKKYPEEVTETPQTWAERTVDMIKQSLYQSGFDPDNFAMMRQLLYGLQTQR
jgi:hypothetical protein